MVFSKLWILHNHYTTMTGCCAKEKCLSVIPQLSTPNITWHDHRWLYPCRSGQILVGDSHPLLHELWSCQAQWLHRVCPEPNLEGSSKEPQKLSTNTKPEPQKLSTNTRPEPQKLPTNTILIHDHLKQYYVKSKVSPPNKYDGICSNLGKILDP